MRVSSLSHRTQRLWWVPVLWMLLLSGCVTDVVYSKPGTTTTVILLRHGDLDEGSQVLNPTGRARAQALVEALKDVSVTAVYSPDLERNLDTVGPLAKSRNITITRTPLLSLFVAKEISREIVTKHAGGTVVWVGNVSGNLQAVYWNLGGTGTGPVEYGDLFFLTVPDQGKTTVVKKRFGP